MRREVICLTLTVFSLALIGRCLSQDALENRQPGVKGRTQLSVSTTRDQRSNAAPDPKQQAQNQNQPAVNQQAVATKTSTDEQAIRQSAADYTTAFNAGDARAAAGQFSENAEYVDPQGILYEGRQAIETLLVTFFENHPERKIDVTIDSVRFLTPTVAIEDGISTVTTSKDAAPQAFQYTAVLVKNGTAWQTASVRDRTIPVQPQHHAQLEQMDWLIGDWVHEGDDAIVHFSCQRVDNGNFLVRKFTVHVAGQETMTGTQRIGWDPRAAKFRTWVFDSDGGYAEGYWHRDQEGWNLKLSGVTPDGQSASCTSIYKFVDGRTMTFQSVDHEVGGIELPDSEPVTIVRQFTQSASQESSTPRQ